MHTLRRIPAVMAVATLMAAGPASAAPVWRTERTAACQALVATRPSLPAHPTRADRRAYLERVRDEGVTPALTALERAVPVNPTFRTQRTTAIAVLRRWRTSARTALVAPDPAAGADRRGLLMARAALALADGRLPCPIPLRAERPAGAVVTRVPDVQGQTPAAAYTLLRARGLRVAIPVGWTEDPMVRAAVWMQYPPAGTRVARGAAVTVVVGGGPVGSPAVGPEIPTAVVPALVGGTVEAARQWAGATGQLIQPTFAPLPPSATGATLEDDYVVAAQSPAAGTPTAFGVPIDHGIRLTPVRVYATIRR